MKTIQKIVGELFLYRQDLKGLKRLVLILFVALMVFEATLMVRTETEATNVCPISDADTFKQMDLATLDGGRFSSKELADYDIILVDVWGTDCPHCVMEMPSAASFSKNLEKIFPDNKVLYIGIVCDVYSGSGDFFEDRLREATRISTNAGVQYPQLIADGEFLTLLAPYVDGLPTVFYLDGQGNVLDNTSGLETSGYVLKVNALLEAKEAQSK